MTPEKRLDAATRIGVVAVLLEQAWHALDAMRQDPTLELIDERRDAALLEATYERVGWASTDLDDLLERYRVSAPAAAH